MTLIKCFTPSHIDNIAAGLRLQPEKMILVGDDREMAESTQRYRDLLKKRGLSTKIFVCDLRKREFGSFCQALYRALEQEDDTVIDLTDGDEMAVLAAGAVLARLENRCNIRVERFDRQSEQVIDCLTGEILPSRAPVRLDVDEVIALHGGALYGSTQQPPVGKGAEAVQQLWNLVAQDPKSWNEEIKLLKRFERYAQTENGLHVCIHPGSCEIPDLSGAEARMRQLLQKLDQCGVLTDQSSRYLLQYRYTDPLMRLCVEKAGNVLELKTLLEGSAVTEQGAPFFHDCRMSVTIDWDGIFYDRSQLVPETRNEIDVVLMHGTTPLFISCKNGKIDDGELYKLHTVARCFGGPHAGKMLVATDLDQKSPAADDAFIQRARDMGIFLVEDAAKLTKQQWHACFKRAMPV